MRPVALAFITTLVGLAIGIGGHHWLTTGNASAAVLLLALGTAPCLALSIFALRAVRQQPRFWPGALAGGLHLLMAYAFFESTRPGHNPPAWKAASCGITISFAACGVLLVLFTMSGCRKNSASSESEQPEFVPASAKVFAYQRNELARVAAEFGRTPREILSKQSTSGRPAVFGALQLVCSWKYINQRPLSDIERFTLSVQGLSLEVINGGFHQYFSNSTADDWDILVWGMQEAGDTEGLARFQEVLAVFPNGRPSRNRASRNRQLDQLGEAQWTVFTKFDERFYAQQFPDWEKAWALIVRRADEIHPEWPEKETPSHQ